MIASALYEGRVVHQRHRPKKHRLEYAVFSLFLDLDDLTELDKNLRLFAHNRWALFSLFDRDHGTGGGDLKAQVRVNLRTAGIDDAEGPVRLLCYPRVLGYGFNPLSVYYCYGREEQLKAMIYEVHNTHGERHSYVIPVTQESVSVRQACDKVFFVSPFMPMDCRYRFHINRPGSRLHLFIHETQQGQALLDAWFTGQRKPLTDRTLLRVALQMPFLTLKVILGIHWEAVKLWRKGLPIFSHTPAPGHDVSYIDR